MTAHCPKSEQISALQRLWRTAFGDSEAYLRDFFSIAFAPERCLCLCEGEKPLAALYWFEERCGTQKFAYLYAVATDTAFRRRGLCRTLLEQTAQRLQTLGFAGALLVPENVELAQMYEKLGFFSCTTVREFSSEAGDEACALRQVDVAEFARLRQLLLPPGSVRQEGEELVFLSRQAAFWAGEKLLAVTEKEGLHLHCAELLGNPAAAPALLRTLGCISGDFRCPGTERPFAYLRPLTPDCSRPAYFGLALD